MRELMAMAALVAVAVAVAVGCPGPDPDVDTDVDTDTDTDVDTDTDTFGLPGRPENLTCAPWLGSPPALLSETGCVLVAEPSTPDDAMIPFGVHSPLWSDGAEKLRFLALPDEAVITMAPDGDFLFPTGAVLGKWFVVDGDLVEVRLLARRADGWVGAAWRWDEVEGDGVLAPSGAELTLPSGQTWEIPSQFQCAQCHSSAAGGALGPEVRQLAGTWQYPSGVQSDQLATLSFLGVLDGPVPAIDALEDPLGDGPLADRARSYLHANCSGCHRPRGGTPVPMDLRYGTALEDSQTCGERVWNPLGLSDMRRIAPGDVAHSMVVARMTTPGLRMPPLGTAIVHDDGSAVVAQWIAEMTSCAP